jgi:hypothetical protein
MPPWGCSLAVKAVVCRAKDRGFKSHHPRGALSVKSHSDSHSECATFVQALEWKDKRRARDQVLSSMRSGLSFQVVQDAKWYGVALQKQFSRVRFSPWIPMQCLLKVRNSAHNRGDVDSSPTAATLLYVRVHGNGVMATPRSPKPKFRVQVLVPMPLLFD